MHSMDFLYLWKLIDRGMFHHYEVCICLSIILSWRRLDVDWFVLIQFWHKKRKRNKNRIWKIICVMCPLATSNMRRRYFWCFNIDTIWLNNILYIDKFVIELFFLQPFLFCSSFYQSYKHSYIIFFLSLSLSGSLC